MITTLQIQEWCKDDAAPRQSELHNQLEYIFHRQQGCIIGHDSRETRRPEIIHSPCGEGRDCHEEERLEIASRGIRAY